MITVTIPARPKQEMWDPAREEFIYIEATREYKITLEHSLVSVSKWESKWKKAFLKQGEKTPEEVLDYIRCMTIEKNIPDEAYKNIPPNEVKRITDYIDDSHTATHINHMPQKEKPGRKDVITSELIYYWMIANQIPFECERWHLNRLMALIQICSVKNSQMYGGKKKSRSSQQDLLRHNSALNASRRAMTGSKG